MRAMTIAHIVGLPLEEWLLPLLAGGGVVVVLRATARRRLEWRDFTLDGARDGHLGLGFDRALQAVECRARGAKEMADLVRPAGFGASVLPPAADPYFRLERRAVEGPVTIAPGFAVLVVTDGDVSSERGELALPRGTTAVLPHACGPLELGGKGNALVCRPPSPAARQAGDTITTR